MLRPPLAKDKSRAARVAARVAAADDPGSNREKTSAESDFFRDTHRTRRRERGTGQAGRQRKDPMLVTATGLHVVL